MYLYLYAPFLKQKKYARDLGLVEGRVTDFGMNGKIAQLSQFLKFPAAVKEFGAKKLTTLVLVGDDALLEEAVQQFALVPVVLGYIPMVESRYGSALGIPAGPEAVQVLAARRMVKCDVGRVENKFFLGTLSCEGKGLELHTPTFSIFPNDHAVLEVVNLGADELPVDGKLSVRITPSKSGFLNRNPLPPTVVQVSSCRLKALKPMLVSLGAGVTLKTPLQVDIIPEAIRMIVGKRIVRRK